MLGENEMKVLRKIASKKKVVRMRNQQIREYCGIQPINSGWKEEEENGTNM